jgi:hypothetical protein
MVSGPDPRSGSGPGSNPGVGVMGQLSMLAYAQANQAFHPGVDELV